MDPGHDEEDLIMARLGEFSDTSTTLKNFRLLGICHRSGDGVKLPLDYFTISH
jgi:hypothetical protein